MSILRNKKRANKPRSASTGLMNTHETISRFLGSLFERDDIIEFRVFEMWTDSETNCKSTNVIDRRYHRIGDSIEAFVQDMSIVNRKRGGNICVGVCPRPQEGCGKKNDIEVARCLWADLDNCSVTDALRRIKKAGLPMPTVVVNSGHGVHLYWVLKKPIDVKVELKKFEALMTSIASAIDGDCVQNVDRLLRLPGFLNVKDVRNGAKPVPCQIVTIQHDLRYGLATFEKWQRTRPTAKVAVPAKPVKETRALSVNDLGLKSEIERRLKDLGNVEVGERSERDFGFLCFLKSHGVDQEEAWKVVSGTGKFAEKGRTYFDRTWAKAKDQPISQSEYFSDSTGTFIRREAKNGVIDIRLANFEARIVADVVFDDGDDVRREFEIEAVVDDVKRRCSIPAEDFAEMKWISKHLGASAIIESGHGIRDQMRAAIQHLSGKIPETTKYAHTGWREHNRKMIFLHAGGGIGAYGVVEGVEVLLHGPLQKFELPVPPKAKSELERSIRAMLQIPKVAPGAVGISTLAAMCRSAITTCDFSVHVTGATGRGKTELAALAQRGFGKTMDARNLPGSWISTANSNEMLAFLAKDVLLTVDDFAPMGSANDVQRQNREADRLFRSQGNNVGRGRLRQDASQRPSKPPRGLIFSTGEELPQGESLRSRILLLDVGPDTVKWDVMTSCQHDATAGLYAQAMAAFIQWLAKRYRTACRELTNYRRDCLAAGSASNGHKRSTAIVADLQFGLFLFLQFACEAEALTKRQADRLEQEFDSILYKTIKAQAEPHWQSDPAQRFLVLIGQAIASGRAHLDGSDGEPRDILANWGHRIVDESRKRFEPQGTKIGWIQGPMIGAADSAEIFLIPDVAYAIAQDLATKINEPLGVSRRALLKRLKEGGNLVSSEESRSRNTVRRTFEGRQIEVIHLPSRALTSS